MAMTRLELAEAYQANLDRLNEMAETLEREKRMRTDAETAEYESILAQNEVYRMKMNCLDNPRVTPGNNLKNADAVLRDARDKKYDVKVVLTRDVMTTAGLEGTGIIPVEEQEMLKPLREGIIHGQLGMNILSGLSGTLRWPLHTKAVATWEDEASELTDGSINFSALSMNGKRLGIAIPVSRTELNDSHGIVERVVREEMPAAIIEAINAALLDLVAEHKVNGNIVEKTVHGPFARFNDANKNCELITLAGAVPTRKELLKAKAAVASKGIEMKYPCWIMTEAMKAELEDTKVDAGSGRFVCENGQILGFPVLTSSKIGEGNIGFGDWSYQAAGFFGATDLTIDPYTLARKHSTDFVLNMRFGTVCLRKEAFVLLQTTAAKTALNALLPTD